MVHCNQLECLVKTWIAVYNVKVKQRFKMLVNVCPDDIWTIQPFVTRLGMVVYYHELGSQTRIRVIKNLYDKTTNAVLFNSSIGDWFWTTIGIWQGCLLSPTLFNTFLKRVMTDALQDHEGTVSIGGRTITSLRFADDINGSAGEGEEPAKLVECLNEASTAYGMEISAEKMKLCVPRSSRKSDHRKTSWPS